MSRKNTPEPISGRIATYLREHTKAHTAWIFAYAEAEKCRIRCQSDPSNENRQAWNQALDHMDKIMETQRALSHQMAASLKNRHITAEPEQA